MTATRTRRKSYKAPRIPLDYERAHWDELLRQAVEVPGHIANCYSYFRDFSVGNSFFLWAQMDVRGIEKGPVANFKKWNGRGRRVKKDEKALWVVVPYEYPKPKTNAAGQPVLDENGVQVIERHKGFKEKPLEYALSQTEGDEYVPEPVGEWNPERALEALGITRVPFEMVNGNVQGYAHPSQRVLAINPVAAHPEKTLVHELGHVLLHTDTDDMTRGEKEMEAECVALLVGDALGLTGADDSRGYVQSWYGKGHTIEAKNARRIMTAASDILVAGWPAKASAAQVAA